MHGRRETEEGIKVVIVRVGIKGREGIIGIAGQNILAWLLNPAQVKGAGCVGLNIYRMAAEKIIEGGFLDLAHGGADQHVGIVIVIQERAGPRHGVGTIPVDTAIGLGQEIVIVIAKHLHGKAELADVVGTSGSHRLGFGFAQGGQEHAGEDGNNGDNHQQFNQCETVRVCFSVHATG